MADASTPAAFLKRSKSKSLRPRATSPTSTADVTETGSSPGTLAAKLKKQQRERSKPKARLSFGGDDEDGEGEVFQVKKSALSRRLRLGSPASSNIALPSNLDQASLTPQSSGIVYSKEYLSELKASTPSTPANRQPAAANYDSELSFDASEMAGAVIVDDVSSMENIEEIPSESSILAAKQKRERLRQTKVQNSEGDDEFIALSVTRKEDTYQGPHPESRLMREDDELGEGDDEFAEYTAAQERIALGKKSKKKEAAKRRSAMQEMINDAEEEDEETIEWEKEQLRRGGRTELDVPGTAPVKQEYKATPIPPPTPLPNLEAAIGRLSVSLTELTASHASSTASMNSLANECIVLDDKEKEMRAMVEKAELKRSWFNAFREWVETVATFLDEKHPILETLESEHVSLLKERSEMVSKRRSQDDEDDLSLFLGSPVASIPDEPEELDELGRVVPHQNSGVARKERRADRIARHSQGTISHDEEGYSTDSSLSPSDAADFEAAIASLQAKARGVLQDVRAVEFRDPRAGLAKWFGGWRAKYTDTYAGAFGGLGMVSAWEFWVRLEMLGWNPVAAPRPLDDFAWYSALYEYSRPTSHVQRSGSAMDQDEDEDADPGLGPDGDLVSAMISTAVVPRLCKVIQGGAFDPYSAKHVRMLVDLAEQVETSATKDKFDLLLKAIIAPFREEVESAVKAAGPYLALGNAAARFDPEAIPARRRFLTRKYKLVSNLVRWRKYTGERFGVGQLATKVIVECMHPVAESGWEVGGEEIMQKVAKVMPSELH